MGKRRRRRSRDADITPVSLRRPSTRAIVTTIAALIVAVTSVIDHSCQARGRGSRVEPGAADKKTGLVTHIIDGDTIDVVLVEGEPAIRVRMLGIDAPEIDRGGNFGNTAAAYAKARCEQKEVTLRLDELQREHDKYGRLLAYVYLPNNELLNESLVRDGVAFSHRRLRCDLSAQLDAAENEARKAKRGLWKTMTVAEMPEWRQEWMAERGLR